MARRYVEQTCAECGGRAYYDPDGGTFGERLDGAPAYLAYCEWCGRCVAMVTVKDKSRGKLLGFG